MADKDQGWHGDSKGHSKAAKGNSKDSGKTNNSEDVSKTSGWHGDSKGHSDAAKGESKEQQGSAYNIFE